jgi:hypothetical protein
MFNRNKKLERQVSLTDVKWSQAEEPGKTEVAPPRAKTKGPLRIGPRVKTLASLTWKESPANPDVITLLDIQLLLLATASMPPLRRLHIYHSTWRLPSRPF